MKNFSARLVSALLLPLACALPFGGGASGLDQPSQGGAVRVVRAGGGDAVSPVRPGEYYRISSSGQLIPVVQNNGNGDNDNGGGSRPTQAVNRPAAAPANTGAGARRPVDTSGSTALAKPALAGDVQAMVAATPPPSGGTPPKTAVRGVAAPPPLPPGYYRVSASGGLVPVEQPSTGGNAQPAQSSPSPAPASVEQRSADGASTSPVVAAPPRRPPASAYVAGVGQPAKDAAPVASPTASGPEQAGAGGSKKGIADEANSGGESPEKGLSIDLLSGMAPVTPDDFDVPTRSVPMSLRQIAASVLKNNRSIQVAAYKPESAKAGIMEAKSAYDPEAFADWTFSRSEAPAPVIISGIPAPNRDFRNNVTRTGITQRIPTGGKVSAYREWNDGTERNPGSDPTRGHGGAYVAELSQPLLNGFADAENRAVIEISYLQADMSSEEFRQTVLETMADAMEAYWAVALAREELRINQETLAMAVTLLNREQGRKQEGIATQLDVNRAREAASTRAYNVLLSREQFAQAQEKLKYHLNSGGAPIGTEIQVDVVESIETPLAKPNLDKAIDAALENRPEYRNAELAIRSGEVKQRYAKNNLLPKLDVVGSVRRNDKDASTPTTGSSTLNTGTDWSAGLAFSMPIGNMKARAIKKKADLETAAAVEDRMNVRDLIITEVRAAVKEMELVVREIPLNKRAMEAATKVLEGEWARLELNQVGNRDLLQAQDLMAVTERNHVQSLVRYNVAVVRLLAAEGTLLDKMGIRLK